MRRTAQRQVQPGRRDRDGRRHRRRHPQGPQPRPERNLAGAGVSREAAAEPGRTPAQVAPAWTLRNPGATTLIGARTPAQPAETFGALQIEFTPAQPTRPDTASAIELGQPHGLPASDHIRRVTTGSLRIETRG
ncbi:aldo/keto reductase [Streptomyces sp. NPDC002553]|uniref:aldo/keto reductase n=1 Tax=Streptomyces sp. NPDC002553 TaxID=3154417 RepID=UPI00331E09E4